MSDVPELIEPVKVLIQQINQTKTTYPTGVNGKREPQNYIARNATVTFEAQIVFGDVFQRPEFSQLGVDQQVRGYFVARYADLAAVGVSLQKGDKIIKLGQLDTEYYLLHSKGDPAAHFSSIGGFTLVRMFFSDKTPIS